MKNIRYPTINIRSKNEFAKHISNKYFSNNEALSLINDVIRNKDNYWHDNSQASEPEKGKYVRTSKGSPLETLLKTIDKRVLKPHDKLLPNFIFGGVSGKNHIEAAFTLTGKKNKRVLLKMDISRFFEQISKSRVFYFFHKKCGCSVKASNILADLCCVPIGEKGSNNIESSLARGFSTSSRLAVWTNLDIFLRLNWRVLSILKGHDPRIVIFVDDIGVSASDVTSVEMEKVKLELVKILSSFDKNQILPVNTDKTRIQNFSDRAEHLGLKLGNKRVSMGSKTQSKKSRVLKIYKSSKGAKKEKLKEKVNSYYLYKKQIEDVNTAYK